MTGPRAERLEGLPPSAKLVVKILEWEGPLTQQAIADHSLLPPRTVRDALTRLEEHGVIQQEVYFPDARQSIYRLAQPDPAATDRPEEV